MARKKKEEEVEVKMPTQSADPQVDSLQKKIKETSIQVNDILVKAGLELAVIHQIRINPELRQEEIAHDIILKPKRNV
jgi:hypothetical protein